MYLCTFLIEPKVSNALKIAPIYVYYFLWVDFNFLKSRKSVDFIFSLLNIITNFWVGTYNSKLSLYIFNNVIDTCILL